MKINMKKLIVKKQSKITFDSKWGLRDVNGMMKRERSNIRSEQVSRSQNYE